MKTTKAMSALYMPHYGITTIVMTSHDKLDLYLKDFKDDGLHLLPPMRRQFIFNQVKSHLLKEDAYFNLNPGEASRTNPRWSSFCDDCLELAALDLYLFGNPIPLIHPDSYAKGIASNPQEAALIGRPTLVEGIAIQRRDH